MGKGTICLIVVLIWAILAIAIAVAFADDEWPQGRKNPFEWVANDRWFLRRHSELLHKRSPRARAPPQRRTDPDGLHGEVAISDGSRWGRNNHYRTTARTRVHGR